MISGKKNGFKLIYNNHQPHQGEQNFFLKMMILFDHTTNSAPTVTTGSEVSDHITSIIADDSEEESEINHPNIGTTQ